jgi:hypothetical protein
MPPWVALTYAAYDSAPWTAPSNKPETGPVSVATVPTSISLDVRPTSVPVPHFGTVFDELVGWALAIGP